MKKLVFITFLFCSSLFAAKATMSQKDFESLMSAQELIEENKIVEAKVILNKLLEKKNDYLKSYTYQFLSNIALQDNKYEKVIEYYKKILELDAFEKESIDKIKLSLARIYLSLEEYKKSIEILKGLQKDSKVSKLGIYENFVYAYYYTKEFTQSLNYANMYNKLSKKKKENIYQLLYSSQIELKNYDDAIKTLEIMVKEWHDKQNYWLQLISLYQEKKRYKEALSTIELTYKEKLLEPKKHTLLFANLLFQNELYNKTSIVLEDGLKRAYLEDEEKIFNLLLSSHLNAKEYDKAIFLLENSKHAKKYKLKKILANLYYEKHAYKNAIKVIEKLHHKNTKRNLDGELCILLALCHYELENTKKCKESLQKALYSKKSKHRAIQIAKTLRIKLDKIN